MNDAIPFGRWLKERRQSLDLTQENLADRVGCALSTIEKVERGLRRPSHQIAGRLSEELRIPLEERATFVAWARYVPSNGQTVLSTSPEGDKARQNPGNLPAAATALIGRARELDETRRLFEQGGVRLLTLLGPPGIGKTRLSLALAESLAGDFGDGAWFVPLAPISDPGLVASSIVRTLGVEQVPGQVAAQSLEAFLRDRQMLLVLDNFEQVISAAPLVSELLAASPRLKLLVTSRAALHIYGEHHFDVPPLDLPDLKNLSVDDDLQSYPAVALFTQRAQAVAPRFSVSEENGRAIAEICARLDGLPLAIELAAARSKLFDPLSILRRLDRRLPLLSSGPQDRAPRQQSLRSAIAWSYDLLNDGEKSLFCKLSVFVGGCTLEAVEAVAGNKAGGEHGALNGYDAPAPEEVLESLVNKSLVQCHDTSDETRFSMLETLREYAWEQLGERGEEDDTRRRHAEYFVSLAEEAEPHLRGTEQKLWLDRLDREHDNLRAALTWALTRATEDKAREKGQQGSEAGAAIGTSVGEIALRLGAALWRFWVMRAYIAEGGSWLRRALAVATERTAARAKASNSAGSLLMPHADYATMEALHQEALAIYRDLDNQQGIARSLNGLGLIRWRQGDNVAARSIFEESLAINRDVGELWGIGAALANLAIVVFDMGDNADARRYNMEAAAVFRELGDKTNMALMLNNLGVIALAEGDTEAAESLWGECLSVYRELNNKGNVGLALINLALLARDRREFDKALALSAEGLALVTYQGDKRFVVHTLVRLAGMAAMRERPEQAARLFGACAALLEELGKLPPSIKADHDHYLTSTRSMLDEARFAECWAEGHAMSMEEAVKYALADDPNEGNKVLNSEVALSI